MVTATWWLAEVGEDGRRLTLGVSLPGSAAYERTHATESSAEVAIQISGRASPPLPGAIVLASLVFSIATVVVHLSKPLGSRFLSGPGVSYDETGRRPSLPATMSDEVWATWSVERDA